MSFEYSTFEITCFINRLRSLQWFCSETDKSSPRALLFVPGPDGRNNPGSVNILKYLFHGSVSKSLFDETLDGSFEILEDIVIMIKEASLSIIYSKPMKDLISPFLAKVPQVIEYCYTAEEESDIDKFQLRKCEHFKRMILEALNPDDGIGLSVPIGYDDIMDVETWPMLQSFALDTVIAPTGFFTNRHNIADISPNLEMLFRTVDSTYVANALQVTKTTIVPHVQQLLMVLQSSVPSQRHKITADDVIGPLEVMYEFGEIESAGSLEKISPPIVFFGPHTTQIGVLQQALAKSDAWRDHTVDDHLHVVFEGCEPSSGMRFCRTFFLKHGTGDTLARDVRNFQQNLSEFSASSGSFGSSSRIDQKRREEEEEDPDLDYERSIPNNTNYRRAAEEKKNDSQDDANNLMPGQDDLTLSGDGEDVTSRAYQLLKADIQRMQALYVKLWFALRCLAYDAFYSKNDILEAATTIQRVLNALLCHEEIEESYPFLESLPGRLQGEEKLQLHIDCMNALGEIVSLEDVNDLGGACWVYIRATINGIHLASRREAVALAVGDTFLFSPLVHAAETDLQVLRNSAQKQALLPHMTDFCCATADIAYFAALNGLGYEEDYTRLVQFMLRNPQLAAPLKLGRALESQQSSASQSRFPCLLDHIALPYFDAEIKSFSSGFIIERINRGHEIPVVVSFERHVRQVWITDLSETLSLAQQRLLLPKSDETMKEIADTLIGYAITFALHNTTEEEQQQQQQEEQERSNPLSRLFQPLSTGAGASVGATPRHVSIIVRLRAGEVGATVLPALDMWKASFRMHDIPVYVGTKDQKQQPLPEATLQSLLSLLDRFAGMSRSGLVFSNQQSSANSNNNGTSGNNSLFSAGTATTLFSGHELSLDSVDVDSHQQLINLTRRNVTLAGVPGIAHSAMCASHALAEVQRLSPFVFEDLMHAVDQRRARLPSSAASSAASPNTSPNGKTTSTTKGWSKDVQRQCAMDVLVGCPGSGLHIVQSLFKQKLSVYYGSSVHIEFVDIDFTRLALSKPLDSLSHSDVVDFLDHKLQMALRKVQDIANSNSQGNKVVLFVTVTMSPLVHVKCCDLWVCLSCVTGLRIVNITSVVSADSLLLPPTAAAAATVSAANVVVTSSSVTAPAGLGLGYEWWRCLTAQTLRPSSANAVLLMEASTQTAAWRAMKAQLAQSNPQAHLLRVHPNIPALSTQDLDYYATRMESHFQTPVDEDLQEYERDAFLMSVGYPSPEQQPYLGRDLRHLDFKTLLYPVQPQFSCHLRCLEYSTADSNDYWALSSVLSLLTLLFPQAKTSTFSLTPHWQAAALSLTDAAPGSFQRLVQLASAKVLTQTHAQELAKRFQHDVSSATTDFTRQLQLREQGRPQQPQASKAKAGAGKTVLETLRAGVLSVVVVMTLQSETLTLGHQTLQQQSQTQTQQTTSWPSRVLIEANNSFIAIREHPASNTDAAADVSRMMIHGVFDDIHAGTTTAATSAAGKKEESKVTESKQVEEEGKNAGFVAALVRACHRHRLRRVPVMTPSDVSEAQQMRIQRLSHFRERALPTGWWYDGHHFVNFHGVNRLLRPDIDEIVHEYCASKNVDIEKHNRLLDGLQL